MNVPTQLIPGILRMGEASCQNHAERTIINHLMVIRTIYSMAIKEDPELISKYSLGNYNNRPPFVLQHKDTDDAMEAVLGM